MIVIDGHLDIAMNALIYNRDLKRTVAQIRADEASLEDKSGGMGRGTVAFPDLRRGGVAISFVTVLARVNPAANSKLDFRTHDIAYAQGQGQLAYYRELARQGVITLIADVAGLDAHLTAWETDPVTTPLGAILTMEGADPIVDPEQVHLWRDDGFRIISLAHYGPSKYAFGTHSDGPITDAGKALLAEMERAKIVLDVTHLCDRSFADAMTRFSGPVLATHSNCRALVPHERQFTDDQLKQLIARGAVIGAALDAWMIQPGWVLDQPNEVTCTLEDYVDQIDHVCQLAGNAEHAAIGTDLDGGYGTEETPRDLDTIADLKTRIPELLANRGYAGADIENIMWRNWVRLLRAAWSE
jgi:membrane dipeptidase